MVCHACFFGIGNRNGKTVRIDIGAQNPIIAAVFQVSCFGFDRFPNIGRNTAPFLRAEFTLQTGRTVQRRQSRFNHNRPRSAKRIPEKVTSAITRKMNQRRRHRLMKRRLIADGTVAALVQADTGGIEKDLADVLHNGKESDPHPRVQRRL